MPAAAMALAITTERRGRRVGSAGCPSVIGSIRRVSSLLDSSAGPTFMPLGGDLLPRDGTAVGWVARVAGRAR
jgi:hypothetical protein